MKHLLLVFSAFLFSQIFYQQQIGLNLILFESLIFGVILYRKELTFNTKASKLIVSSVIISLAIVIINNSLVSIYIHLLNWIVMIGLLNYKNLTKLSIGVGIGIISCFEGLKTVVDSIINEKKSSKNIFKRIKFKLYIIPVIILLIFQGLYRLSNEAFDNFMSRLWSNFFELFNLFDWHYFPLFLLGLFICAPIFYRTRNKQLEIIDIKQEEQLLRIKKKMDGIFNPLRLKNQYKSALFLFFTLNILISFLLVFEIYEGWFNFQYTNQNLSHYVHQGTYILIFSILVSMGLVLFYFKGNLNFIPNNKSLIRQSNIWIILNSILTFSVAIRCFHYIDNFGLTQKRIGLFTFLISVILGLISIYIKVNQLKTSAYLWRRNILSSWLILNTLALFNWDIIIAKYNVYYHSKTNIEISYLSGLSNKSLYILDTDEFQNRYKTETKFNLDYITNKKKKFVEKWENQNWLSWNFADYYCYSKLTKK